MIMIVKLQTETGSYRENYAEQPFIAHCGEKPVWPTFEDQPNLSYGHSHTALQKEGLVMFTSEM